MKQTQFILAAVILLFVFSCNNQDSKQAQNAQKSIIQGKILHPNDYPIIIQQGTKTDSIIPDSNANFNFTLEIETADYIEFIYRRKTFPLYIYPGDSIEFNFDDANTKMPFEFLKGNTAASAYLIKSSVFKQNSTTFTELLYDMNIDSFLIKSAKTKQEMLEIIDIYSEIIADKKFVEKEAKRIDLLFYNLNFRYVDYFSYFSEDSSALKKSNFYKFVDDLNIDDESALSFNSYPTAIINFINSKMDDTEVSSYEGLVHEQIELVNKKITNQNIKEAVLFKIIMEYGRYNGFEAIDEAYQTFINEASDEYRIANLSRLYKTWDKIKKGKIAPKFSYPDIKGDSIALSDFKGEILYIDVWATWCGPCRVEIPAFAKLVNDYNDQAIQFLSVSVDEDRTAWMKFVEEEEHNWPQIHTGGWDCSISKDYFIKGIPRFILIDANGKIIDATAPRPSSEEIRPLLDSLINNQPSKE